MARSQPGVEKGSSLRQEVGSGPLGRKQMTVPFGGVGLS